MDKESFGKNIEEVLLRVLEVDFQYWHNINICCKQGNIWCIKKWICGKNIRIPKSLEYSLVFVEFTNWKEILNEEVKKGIRINDLANPVAAKVHLLLYTNEI